MRYIFTITVLLLLALLIDACTGKPGNNLPDFLALSDSAKETMQGYFQGVDKSDSAGPYIYKEYYSDSLSFEMVFVPKHGDKSKVSIEDVAHAKANDYADFLCFVFVYPMTDPDKMADYHDDNTKYPVYVKSYIKDGKEWQFLSQQKAGDLTELSKVRIGAIYSKQ